MKNLLSFIWSPLANLTFAISNWLHPSNELGQYNARTDEFEKLIASYFIEQLLKEADNALYQQLASIETATGLLRLPYIDMGDEHTTITPELTQAYPVTQHNQQLLSWLKQDLHKHLHNGATYRLAELSADNKMTLAVGDYYATLSNSDVHYLNLTRYFPLNPQGLMRFLFRYQQTTVAWLWALHETAIKRNFQHYTASVGCAVLTVLRGSDGIYRFLTIQNSPSKATGGRRHVVPTFMFSPVTTNPYAAEQTLDIFVHIVKEYGEELLGLAERDDYDSYTSLLDILRQKPLLKALLDRKNIDIRQTGVVLDIFRLRPEFTYVLIIHDERYAATISTNWEIEAQSLVMTDIDDSEAIADLLDYPNSRLCPPGLAALAKGVPLARKIIKETQGSS